jgi:hypothetical protein
MSSPQIKYGILRTRDLVQLYFGARMVASVLETSPGAIVGPTVQIISGDPRRIKYEIFLANISVAADYVSIFSNGDTSTDNPQLISLPPGASEILTRTFFGDLDAVTLPVFLTPGAGSINVSVRETFLTTLPADELP